MTAPDRLRFVIQILRREGSAEAVRVAKDLERYLAGAADGLTLDLALGVSPEPGASPWYEIEARARRDAALRALREHHFADLSIRASARAIREFALRHRGDASSTDSRKRLLAEALEPGLPIPRGRQLENILRND